MLLSGEIMIRPFRGVHPQIHPTAYVDPSAQVIGDVHLGEEASIWCNCTVRGDIHYIRIGDGANSQENSVIPSHCSHPTIVEQGVTVGHNLPARLLCGTRIVGWYRSGFARRRAHRRTVACCCGFAGESGRSFRRGRS